MSVWKKASVLTAIVMTAFAVRLIFFDYESADYTGFVRNWYEFIEQNGGFAAFEHQFANYNVPYLYLLAGATYLPIPPLVAVKLISIVFDGVLGWYAYRLLATRYPNGWVAPGGAVVTVLLPTVVLNSSMWAQADSIYVAFSVGGLYYLVQRRPWLACVSFGLAFSFKLQAVFLFPVLLLLAVRKWLPWRALLAIPGVYFMLGVPALLAGASPSALLSIYLEQADSYGQLTMNAPNAYQFLTVDSSETLRIAGVLVTGVVVLALIVAARRVELTPTRIVLAATVSALLVPFLLPSMHERYFYTADVLTVIAAFWLPRELWYAPVLTQFASLFSYLPFLSMSGGPGRVIMGGPPPGAGPGIVVTPQGGPGGLSPAVIDFRILAAAMLVALIGVLAVTWRHYGSQRSQVGARTMVT
ncbi:Gpi18-like mannosyltransferase [Herbihabitans rhizosphaerae]|uniref:Gpi18-like mannosyltransferase n=1 Tax=Herbihabitans rhizosphaerae TaxID=1872711 RepID=A0A4Q7L4X2_9PSEU|nr:DUF2029 domain-containing protein [Herbihabitans rhizosphaerae]RZS44294.1 Gpi18-like mannosyltransferase [Herbihabitans rhizosphaerae]